jgi:signal transduction histidine kinase
LALTELERRHGRLRTILEHVVVDELRSRRRELLATIAQGDEPTREARFEALMNTVRHACSSAVERIAVAPCETTPDAPESAAEAPAARLSEQLLECIRRGEVDAVLGTGPMAGEVIVLKTRQLEEENCRLIEALKQEKERLEEFAFATAHDLRGPLSNIEAALAALLEERARSRLPLWSVDSLRQIEHAAVRMHLLVSDLMVLGEVGTEGELVERVPLLDVVTVVLDGQRPALARTRVHVEIIGQLPTVRGRIRHLEAMFDNLLDNAIRYASVAAKGRVQIACEQRGDEIVICVRDNGPGFDPREAEAVFGPYVCLDRRGDNTGLGLAIVRNAARAHGGRAWVETVLGEGTAAFVTLPVGCLVEPDSADFVVDGSPAL